MLNTQEWKKLKSNCSFSPSHLIHCWYGCHGNIECCVELFLLIFILKLYNKYTLFDGLAYNTCGYFASCVVFSEARRGEEKYEQWAKCPLVLYAKPSNKRFIIPLQKKKLSGNWLLFFGKSIQRHPDSVCENDVNN